SLRRVVADDLTRRYGEGPWSSSGTETAVKFDMRRAMVCVARSRGMVIATLNLSTRKPWAIDKKYFSPCNTPLYLTSMAVHPELQRTGIGRRCVDEARKIGKRWPSDAIRLDAACDRCRPLGRRRPFLIRVDRRHRRHPLPVLQGEGLGRGDRDPIGRAAQHRSRDAVSRAHRHAAVAACPRAARDADPERR